MVLAFGRGRGIGTAAARCGAAGIAVSGAGPALAGAVKLMNELPVTAGMARCDGGAKRSVGGPNAPGCAAEIVWLVAGVAVAVAVVSAEASFGLAPLGFFLSCFSRAAAICVSADFLPAPV